MFEYLDSMNSSLVVGGTHFAGRVLKHRKRIRRSPRDLWYPDIEDVPSAEQVDVGLRLISDIEAAEGKPVKELDEQQAWDYIGKLADISFRLYYRDVKPDRATGQRLLEEMRRIPVNEYSR